MKQQKKVTIPVTTEGSFYLHVLIAAMIGDVSLYKRLKKDVTALPFSKGAYAFERNVLDVLKALADRDVAPTEETVLRQMVETIHYDETVAQNGLRTILKEKIHVPENGDEAKRLRILEANLNTAYHSFDVWFSTASIEFGLAEALDILRSPSIGPYSKRLEEAMSKIARHTSPLTVIEYARPEEEYELLVQEQTRRIDGQDFPDTPFVGLNELIGTLVPGDPMVLSGVEGSGKSSLADGIARWAAWKRGLHVTVIATETKMSSYAKRFIASQFGIPSVAFNKDMEVNFPSAGKLIVPRVDFRHPFWIPIIGKDAVHRLIEERNTAKGTLTRIRMTKSNMPAILSTAMQEKRNAEREGKQFLLIVDYLQKIVWGNAPEDQWNATTIAASEFKDFCDAQQIYGILLSQETQDEAGKTRAYGGRSVAMMNQQHISLRRPKVQNSKEGGIEKEYVTDAQGHVLLNGIGLPRMMATKEGDATGKNAVIEVIKANEGTLGKAPIWFEGALYNAYDYGCPPTYPLLDIARLRSYQKRV